jgi:hypothetical protein
MGGSSHFDGPEQELSMRYPNASTEPLEIIRVNECESDPGSLATKRFQALWNEIERLRAELQSLADDPYMDPEGTKQHCLRALGQGGKDRG